MSKFLDSNGVAYLWGKVKEHVAGKVPTKTSQLENDSGYLTEADVPDAVTVDSALSATSTNPVQNKAINTALAGKVDKVSGKGLSANDYTTAEKTKLSGIAEGANKTTVVNNLTSTSTASALSAAQGKALKDMIDNIDVSGGNGLPEGGEPNMMLVTDGDGATKWDQRTHWAKKGEKVLLPEIYVESGQTPIPFRLNLEEGNLYTITVNGEEEKVIAMPVEPVFGVPAIGLTASDGSVSFAELTESIDNYEGLTGFITANTDAMVSVILAGEEVISPVLLSEEGAMLEDPPKRKVNVGETYTVSFNNEWYKMTAVDMSDMMPGAVGIGNIGAVSGGEDTGEPFAAMFVPDDLAVAAGGYAQIIPLIYSDDAVSFAMYAEPEVIHKLDPKYLPDGYGGGSGSAGGSGSSAVKNSNIVNGSQLGSVRTVGASDDMEEYLIGPYAFATGRDTKAKGRYSFAQGYDTVAEGDSSHAEGENTYASWKAAHAEGKDTYAEGLAAHAEGLNTRAHDEAAHAEGYGTIAWGKNSHVEGKYNKSDVDGRYAHIVGNGTDDDYGRSNAHTLDWDGNAWFAGDVFVGGTSQDEGKKLATVDGQHGVSVKEYGAVGDGVKDDTQAIKAALAASSNVYAPEGTYLISSPLSFRDNNCRFHCEGGIKVDHCAAFVVNKNHCDLYIRKILTAEEGTGYGISFGEKNKSVYYNNVEIGITEKLLEGLTFEPDGNCGVAYTNVRFKEIRADCCILFNPSTAPGSFINENTFYGGALVGNYAIETAKNGSTDPFNGNKFYNVALEGCENGMHLRWFQFNEFHGCRFSKWENSWDTFIEFGEDANRNTFNYTGFVFANQLVQKGENPEYYNYFDGLIKYTDDATDGVDIGKRGYFAKNQMIIKDCDRYYDYVDINQTVDLSTQPFAIEGRTYNVTATEGTELVLTLPRGYWYGDATFFYVNLICEGTPNVVLRHPEGFMAALTEPGLYKVQCNDVRGWFAHKLV